MTRNDVAPQIGATMTQAAYRTLHSDILDCRYVPSEKLRILDLCQQLDASPGAVREALARLTSDGFVVAEPQKGFSVAPVSILDLEKLTFTRIELERISMESSIAHGDTEWEARLVAAHHRLSKTPKLAAGSSRMSNKWSDAHGLFHEAIVSACDNHWVLRLRANLFLQAERYRRLAHAYDANRDVDKEHAAIMEAVLARDVPRSIKLMTIHFEETLKRLVVQADILTTIRGNVRPIRRRSASPPSGGPAMNGETCDES